MIRRTAAHAALAAAAVAALAAVPLWRSGRWDRYALIVVTETNSAGLLALPPGGDVPRAVAVDETTRTLRPLRPEYSPDGRTRALVVYDVECAGVRVFSDAHRVNATPYSFQVGEPVAALSEPLARAGGPTVGAPLVDNRMRLYSAPVTVTSVRADGTVDLKIGDEEVTLGPGEAWAVARLRDGSSVINLGPGRDWETVLRTAFLAGEPITRLDVFNHGAWRKERVERWDY